LKTYQLPQPAESELFGQSVAADAQNVLVGAPAHDMFTGAAYLFDTRTGALVQSFANPAPTPGGDGQEDRFGWAVALSEESVFVGNPTTDAGARDRGVVHEFDRTNSELRRMISDLPDSPSGTDAFFGHSIWTAGKRLLVGAPGAFHGNGAVFLYKSTPRQNPKRFLNPNPSTLVDGGLGSSIALFRGDVLAGAPESATSLEKGSAYLFDAANRRVLWRFEGLAPGGSADEFGSSVATDDRYVAIGASTDSTVVSAGGAVYVFTVVD
jgi:hypothetical protein